MAQCETAGMENLSVGGVDGTVEEEALKRKPNVRVGFKLRPAHAA